MDTEGSAVKGKNKKINNSFEKGFIMKNSVTFKFLVLAVFIMATCVVTFAEDQTSKDGDKEVRTGLEQRMLKRISVDFRDTRIDDVLRIMSEQADVDIVKSPKVVGNVTATLTDVPLEEALNNILAAHGYGYVVDRNMIRIAPVEEIVAGAERLANKIYRITYADVEEVTKAIKEFVSSRGSVSSNPGTSNIIVTDTESKIKAIDTFVEEVDRITPQILVEVRIYDITTKDRLDLGIEWQAGRNTTFASTLGANPTAGSTDSFIRGTSFGATSNSEDTTGTLRFGWLKKSVDIDMQLTAEQENISAKLLANPRIMVLDNEVAMIKIIEELAFQELTQTGAGGSIGTTEFREVGVELEVTPHVTRDQMVRLHLLPKFSINTGVTQVAANNNFPQPVVDRREAETTLLVEDGKTVVLGGLRKKNTNLQDNKIPLLGDLPLLGPLFRFKGEEIVTSELVVFITPWIVDTPEMTEAEVDVLEQTEIRGPVVKTIPLVEQDKQK